MKIQYICFLILFLLCSCHGKPDETIVYPQKSSDETSTVPLETAVGIVPESEAEIPEVTVPEPEAQETEPIIETEQQEETAETEPIPEPQPSQKTEPPVPPELPEDLHTNITDPEAAFILMDIFEAVTASTDAGVYFIDVQEEYWFGIDEEIRYHTASTVKPVYCQYLLSSGTDIGTEVTLQQISRTSITGKLGPDDIGSTFTVGELIEYSIRYSDNQAYRLLYETFGIEGYNKYVAAFGSGGLAMDAEWEWCRSTPKKLSLAMLDIYRYGEENSVLIDHMKNTTYNGQIPAGTRYETAHKYGNNGGSDGYHDTAIVYAPERAYVLTIMTHIDPELAEDEDAVFRRVSELCEDLHKVLFVD